MTALLTMSWSSLHAVLATSALARATWERPYLYITASVAEYREMK
jgi:hypothetical protein